MRDVQTKYEICNRLAYVANQWLTVTTHQEAGTINKLEREIIIGNGDTTHQARFSNLKQIPYMSENVHQQQARREQGGGSLSPERVSASHASSRLSQHQHNIAYRSKQLRAP